MTPASRRGEGRNAALAQGARARTWTALVTVVVKNHAEVAEAQRTAEKRRKEREKNTMHENSVSERIIG